MTDYDVVVIGAGAAGLSAGALLATEGKRVLVADRSPVLGGRPTVSARLTANSTLGPGMTISTAASAANWSR
jgi:phytoene dehydrogenase-like protein